MTTPLDQPWLKFFPATAGAENVSKLRFRLVRKHGHPLLLLPQRRSCVASSLSLFPAQTGRAKLARAAISWSARIGLPLLTSPVELQLDLQSPEVKFLRETTGAQQLPAFAMHFGNPNAAGQRFILLGFDELGRPLRVIKAGVGSAATRLIQAEATFLSSPVAQSCTAPQVFGQMVHGETLAMALEYLQGSSPNSAAPESLSRAAELLSRWLIANQRVTLASLLAWQRLGQAAAHDELFQRINRILASRQISPAVFHGDFVPWNIRVDPTTGNWRVLDWERGEPQGPPAWDLFHFVVQPAILVKRLAAAQIVILIEALFRSVAFGHYARLAGLTDNVRPLFLAYLLYCRDVLKPTEGLPITNALLELLRRRWEPN